MSTGTFNETNIASINKTFLSRVFGWMSFGLVITAIISFVIADVTALHSMIVTENGLTLIGYLAIFSPFIFVLLMSFGYKKLPYATLLFLFMVYSAIMGISLSFISLVYTAESIYIIFVTAALMFGSMSVLGYVTKTDLSNIGSVFMMVLIGLIMAGLINLFLKSATLSYIISMLSVIVFCGLTAFDIQKLKQLTEKTSMEPSLKNKLGILGALILYLDFINLFMSLLNLFGKRRD
jgi:FtsH-binding integral membrane protein